MIYWQYGKSEHIKAACPPAIGGANPPDERKEGDANDYISCFNSFFYVHCTPRGFVLYILPGKEIAATTRNSDGGPLGL